MLVKEARQKAIQWVTEEGSKEPGFFGAFFGGSTSSLPDDALFKSTSDVDIGLVVDSFDTPYRQRKFLYDGIVIESTYEKSDNFRSPETILGSFPLAHHFAHPCVIADPSGQLGRIQTAVADHYAEREWVLKRCSAAREWLLKAIGWFSEAEPLLDQVYTLLYPIPCASHIILLADLRNPTVKRSPVAAKEVLDHFGFASVHSDLLTCLGSKDMTRQQVKALLVSCTEAYEVAKDVVRTPFFLSSTISPESRSIAIEGSREMIDQGFHREAVFWIAFIHHMCQQAIENDGSPEQKEQSAPKFDQLLTALGIASLEDRRRRHTELQALATRIWEIAEAIMASNPAIVD